MRLGLFGGTFDPPHVGHLLAASDAYEALRLDLLSFIPANIQPLKEGATRATGHQRLEMLKRLVADDSRFGVDPMEVDRPGLSFTVDTLRQIARQSPGAELFFIVGMDVLESFDRWREPEEVMRLARLVLVQRHRGGDMSAAVRRILERGGARAPMVLETRRVDVSSTEVRERVARGLSIRGFVPAAVADVIAAAGLYR